MDGNAFSMFGNFLENLLKGAGGGAAAGASPQGGGLADSNAWMVPQQEFSPSPDYDVNLARQMVNRYIEAGFDPRYAVGMVANSVQESGLNPNAYNKNEDAIGLFQHRFDRAQNLRDFAARQGSAYNDLMTQVDFSIYEKFNGEKGVIQKIYNQDPQTAADFAGLIDKYYERSAGTERGRRRNLASDMWRRFYGDKQYGGAPAYPQADKLNAFFATEPGQGRQQTNPFMALFGGGQASDQEGKALQDMLMPASVPVPEPRPIQQNGSASASPNTPQGGKQRAQMNVQEYLKNLSDAGVSPDQMVQQMVQMTGVSPEFAQKAVQRLTSPDTMWTKAGDPKLMVNMAYGADADNPALTMVQEGQPVMEKSIDTPMWDDTTPPKPITVDDKPAEQKAEEQPSVQTTPPSGGLPASAIGQFLAGPAAPLVSAAKKAAGGAMALGQRFIKTHTPDAELGTEGATAYEEAEKDLGITPPTVTLDLPDVPKPRRTYGEADNIRNEFTRLWKRDKGESDQAVRARRRALLVQSGEVLQSISLGQKFDAGLGARMNIAEQKQLYDQDMAYAQESRMQETLKADVQQRDFGNRMAMVQENRMQDRLQLDQAMFDWTRTTKLAELGKDEKLQAAMADWATKNGYAQYADLIRAGGSGVAGQMILNDMKRKTESTYGPSSFSVSAESLPAIEEQAAQVGKSHLVPIVKSWEKDPRAAETAYKEIMEADGQGDQVTQDKTREFMEAVPEYIDPQTRNTLYARARSASKNDDLADDFYKAVDAAIADSPVDQALKQMREVALESHKLAKTGAQGLREAAETALSFATNPAYESNPLKGNVLVPIAKYLNTIPGVGEVFEEATGVTSTDVYTNSILQAVKNGQLGNLAQGVTGQLSNLEGQTLLSILGDGRVTRTEIMALSQAMLKRAERADTAFDASMEYERKSRENPEKYPPSAEKQAEYVNRRVNQVHGETFKKLDSKEDFAEYTRSKIKLYADAAGMEVEEYMAQSPGKVSSRLLGEVVMVPDPTKESGYKLQPLFSQYYPDTEYTSPEEEK